MNRSHAAMRKVLDFALAAALSAVSVGAQQLLPKKSTVPKGAAGGVRYLNPEGLVKNPRYTQVVEVKGGRLLLISGQVASDASRKIVGAGDIRAQTKQVFENLQVALHAAGADLATLSSSTRTWWSCRRTSDSRQACLSNVPQPPTSTTVGVTSLVDPEASIEIEAVAFLPMDP